MRRLVCGLAGDPTRQFDTLPWAAWGVPLLHTLLLSEVGIVEEGF